jgi:hypothetical protein
MPKFKVGDKVLFREYKAVYPDNTSREPIAGIIQHLTTKWAYIGWDDVTGKTITSKEKRSDIKHA